VFLLLKLIRPAILVIALVAAYLLVPAIGNASGKTLHRGVASGVGGTSDHGSRTCSKRGTVTWRCRVYAKSGTAPATYSVRMRDRRCWSARLTRGQIGGKPLAQKASGCLHLRDQLPTVSSLTT
jgi:hypothetical protein